MAGRIPAKLRTPELSRFIIRASQLETVKPVIAYWCEYWIVNQILSKGLHNGDAETLQYTTVLMDKLEEIKAANSSNDAIIDDAAGQAYVEDFGLETFERADRAVRANKVTKQTADTFQAAATFLELVNIWGTPDAETQSKIKYAKWNALRIAKALKEGKDPNESNPKPSAEEDLPALDPDDPEVQQFRNATEERHASVEEVPDEQDRVEDQSLHPSAQFSARESLGSAPTKPAPSDLYSTVQDDSVSPLDRDPSPAPAARNNSIGGGYFPVVPTFRSESRDATLPTAPPGDTIDLGLPEQPTAPPGTKASPDFESFPPPTLDNESAIPPPFDYYKDVLPPSGPPPPEQHVHYAAPVPPPIAAFTPQPYHPSQVAATSTQAANHKLNTDDVAIAKAQKHARWAISALNFEDADTAVKELKAALQTLGAQ